MTCDEITASSLKVSVPTTRELSRGANVTETGQVEPALMAPQLFLAVTLAAEETMLLRWRRAFPQFFTCTIGVLEFLAGTEPNLQFKESGHTAEAATAILSFAMKP